MAIKVIEHSADDNSKLDGLRESLLCSNIQHPNVVSLTFLGRSLLSLAGAEGQGFQGFVASAEAQGILQVFFTQSTSF